MNNVDILPSSPDKAKRTGSETSSTLTTSHSIDALPIRPSERLLTRREAADYLGVSPKTLASWASSGRYGLEIVQIGARLVRYRKADLDALILAHLTRAKRGERREYA